MKLPDEVKAIRTRWLQMFPLPSIVQGVESLGSFEERMRRWSIGFAEQVAYELPRKGWGVKRGDFSRPIGKDTIAQLQPDQWRLLCWDLATGAGTGHPSLNEDPDSQEINDQFFVVDPADFTPRNHLSAVPPVVPLPTPGPVPIPVDVPTRSEFEALRSALEHQEGLVKQLEDSIDRGWKNHEAQLAELRGQVVALTAVKPAPPRGPRWPWG